MKTHITKPTKARIKGNIIADWDTLLTKTAFEDYHVTREQITDITYNNKTYKALRLNAHAETVYITATVDNNILVPGESVATVTGQITYHEATNNGYEVEPVPYQQVTIYDNEKQINTLTTNSTGHFSFEYTGESGIHNIEIKSAHANGFNNGSKKLEIIVQYPSRLDINPVYNYELGAGESKVITAVLTDNTGTPVADEPVLLYEGFRPLAMLITDEKGQITYEYSESENRGEPTVITFNHVPTHMYNDIPTRITGNLSTISGTPVTNMEVTLYSLYHSGARKWVNTDNNGDFTIVYTPEFDYEVPYYVAFKSAVHDTTNNQYVDFQPTWEHLGDYTAIEPFDTYFYMDLERWNYATLEGTSVPAGSQINPSVVDGKISTGRGKVVYYVPRIPSDLTEWTLYCRLHGTNLYNRIGVSTITEVGENVEYDNNSTWLLADLVPSNDNSTSHVIGFRFMDNTAYLYCDYIYTGISKTYTNTNNLHLIGYSNCYYSNTNFPLVFEEVRYYDAVNLSNIPSGGGQ